MKQAHIPEKDIYISLKLNKNANAQRFEVQYGGFTFLLS